MIGRLSGGIGECEFARAYRIVSIAAKMDDKQTSFRAATIAIAVAII